MPSKKTLKARLLAWKPPRVDTSRKPKGVTGRAFPSAVSKIRGGGFRPGARA